MAGVDGVGDETRDEADGLDGVVIAGNGVVHRIGIAIRIKQRNDGNAELLRLRDRNVLAHGIDHVERGRQAVHVPDPVEETLELCQAVLETAYLLLGEALPGVVRLLRLHLFHLRQTLADGGIVRQHAPQPTLIHKRHPHARSFLLDNVLRLLLRADEQYFAVMQRQFAGKITRFLQSGCALLQIDDVDFAARHVDVRLHLGIPPVGGMPKMHARVKQIPQTRYGHSFATPSALLHLAAVRLAATLHTLLSLARTFLAQAR